MKKLLITAATIATMLGSLGGVSFAAGSANYSLSPASGSENINTTFGIAIYENGDQVNVVTADLTYDPSQLQFVGINTSASAFPNQVSGSGGSGSIDISRYTAPGTTVSGTQEVAVVTFKALAGSGNTSVTMAGSSKIASSGADIWSHAATGASYTLTTPAPTPAPTPTPTPAGSGSTSNTKTSTTGHTSATTNTTTPTQTTPTSGTLGATTQANSQKNTSNPSSHKGSKKAAPKSHRTAATFTYSALILVLAVIAIGWAWIMRGRKTGKQ